MNAGAEHFRSGAVYLALADVSAPGAYGHPLKIGSAADPEGRVKQLQTGCPGRIWLEATIAQPSLALARAFERDLHRRFEYLRLQGEWFVDSQHIWDFVEPEPGFRLLGEPRMTDEEFERILAEYREGR